MASARRRRREYFAGVAAVGLAVAVVSFQTWPVPTAVRDEPMLETMLRDRALIGLLRLAVVVLTLYGIASVPALIVAGRWATGMGTGGIVADARDDVALALERARQRVAELQVRNAHLTSERDEWANLVDARTRPD